jgi:hypothetical protein
MVAWVKIGDMWPPLYGHCSLDSKNCQMKLLLYFVKKKGNNDAQRSQYIGKPRQR